MNSFSSLHQHPSNNSFKTLVQTQPTLINNCSNIKYRQIYKNQGIQSINQRNIPQSGLEEYISLHQRFKNRLPIFEEIASSSCPQTTSKKEEYVKAKQNNNNSIDSNSTCNNSPRGSEKEEKKVSKLKMLLNSIESPLPSNEVV